VKRLYAWFAGVVGGAAVYRALKRQPAQAPAEPDPADELKAKLAEARAAGDDRAEFEAGETPVDEVTDVEARRRSVHDQARAAIDEMKRE
jgi:acetyl-CoA carboxylase carboxyltransferase component